MPSKRIKLMTEAGENLRMPTGSIHDIVRMPTRSIYNFMRKQGLNVREEEAVCVGAVLEYVALEIADTSGKNSRKRLKKVRDVTVTANGIEKAVNQLVFKHLFKQ